MKPLQRAGSSSCPMNDPTPRGGRLGHYGMLLTILPSLRTSQSLDRLSLAEPYQVLSHGHLILNPYSLSFSIHPELKHHPPRRLRVRRTSQVHPPEEVV